MELTECQRLYLTSPWNASSQQGPVCVATRCRERPLSDLRLKHAVAALASSASCEHCACLSIKVHRESLACQASLWTADPMMGEPTLICSPIKSWVFSVFTDCYCLPGWTAGWHASLTHLSPVEWRVRGHGPLPASAQVPWRTMALMVAQERPRWLNLSSLSQKEKAQLLNVPVDSEGPFSPLVYTMQRDVRKRQRKVKCHVSLRICRLLPCSTLADVCPNCNLAGLLHPQTPDPSPDGCLEQATSNSGWMW